MFFYALNSSLLPERVAVYLSDRLARTMMKDDDGDQRVNPSNNKQQRASSVKTLREL